MDLVGDQPICACTAWACMMKSEIFEFLKDGFHEVSNTLDLSFDDDSVAVEQIPFLAT